MKSFQEFNRNIIQELKTTLATISNESVGYSHPVLPGQTLNSPEDFQSSDLVSSGQELLITGH